MAALIPDKSQIILRHIKKLNYLKCSRLTSETSSNICSPIAFHQTICLASHLAICVWVYTGVNQAFLSYNQHMANGFLQTAVLPDLFCAATKNGLFQHNGRFNLKQCDGNQAMELQSCLKKTQKVLEIFFLAAKKCFKSLIWPLVQSHFLFLLM